MINLVIGTAQFGQNYGITNTQGALTGQPAQDIIRTALDHNVHMFDTARLYGESESVLGQALGALLNTGDAENDSAHNLNIDTSDIKIITKYYASLEHPRALFDEFKQTQDRLQGQPVYAVLIHNFDSLKGEKAEEIWQNLQALKEHYGIVKTGVSVYDPEDLIEIAARFPVDLVQLPCNMLDQRFLHGDIQALKREKNIEFHARSLFLQGVLLCPAGQLPDHFKAHCDVFEKPAHYAQDQGLIPLDLCLAYAQWTQQHGMIDRWVVGVDSATHLAQIINASEKIETAMAVPDEIFKSFATDIKEITDPRLWIR